MSKTVEFGPGCMDTTAESFSADVALKMQALHHGDTVATLHLITKNQDPELASVVESIGIELTSDDLIHIAIEALALSRKEPL